MQHVKWREEQFSSGQLSTIHETEELQQFQMKGEKIKKNKLPYSQILLCVCTQHCSNIEHCSKQNHTTPGKHVWGWRGKPLARKNPGGPAAVSGATLLMPKLDIMPSAKS